MPTASSVTFARVATAAITALSLGACTSRTSGSADSVPPPSATNATVATSDTAHNASAPMSFSLTSSAFAEGAAIPTKYTCEGVAGTSPPLAWSGAPSATRSFALIADDPDAPDPAAPKMTYVHWVAYNIPASTTSLAENASVTGMPAGAVQGNNGANKPVFASPCPPIGRHRYFFKLYALDAQLSGLSSPGKAELEKAMQGHVIGTAQLMGTYQKTKKSS